MKEQLKTDFEKILKKSNFSEKDIEFKKKILIDLLKVVFQVENLKIGNF